MIEALTQEDIQKVAEYRANYLPKRYGKQPSVTADIIAMRPSLGELRNDQWRENPEFAFEMLVIKRGQWPEEGKLALPGGFVRGTETVEEAARRELKEETSLSPDRLLIPIGTFSRPERDIRTRVITNSFIAICKRGEGNDIKGGDDADEAMWVKIRNPAFESGRFEIPFYSAEKLLFKLEGSYADADFGGGVVTSVDHPKLAFDHDEIIATAFLKLRSLDLRKLVLCFLPDEFTLSNYIDIYQYLTGNSIDPTNIPNFRRQLTSNKDAILVSTGVKESGNPGHAPATLFRRKR